MGERRYCKNCKQMVATKRDVEYLSTGKQLLLCLLFCLGVVPGIIYYFTRPERCPRCKDYNWGEPPEEKS